MVRRRWWLLVKDVNGTVIFDQAFRTRAGASRHGRAIMTWPLNTFEIRRAGSETNRGDA